MLESIFGAMPEAETAVIPWLLAIGLISMLGQVVLLRELNVAFYGSELVYILALGWWLLWTALGASLGRRHHLPRPNEVRLLLLAFAWTLPLTLVWIRGLRVLLGAVPGAYLPFGRQLMGMSLSLLPVGMLVGLLFARAAKIYVGERRSLAGAYAIESAGGLAGGILATLVLVWGVQNLVAALVCGLVAALATVHAPSRGRPRWVWPAVGATGGALLLGLVLSAPLDDRLTSWNHPSLLASRDTPYGRVTVSSAEGQLSVFENDALAFESEGTGAEEFAHLAAIQRPHPRRLLVLGGGLEGLVRELLKHRPEAIDYVELNATLLELVTPYLPHDTADSLEAEGVRVIIADPRRFVDGGPQYDLILIGMPEPESGQANRFYTREFFARCAGSLTDGGVLAFRLRGAENLWTPQLARRTASIHRALCSVFRDVVVLPGVTNIVLASSRELHRDPAVLGRRLVERGIEARRVIPAYVDYLYTNDRFFEIAALLAATEAPMNTDLRPICYQYTMLIWLSRFYLGAASIEMPALEPADIARSPGGWVAAGGVLGLFLWARRRPLARRSLLSALAGCVGMVLETVLILRYQTIRGVLYQDLGLLLTMFMAGLALGAAGIARRVAGGGPGGGRPGRATGGVLVVAMVGLNLLTAALLQAGRVRGMAATAPLLLGCGALVAAIFAYAGLRRRPDQRAVVAPLYAADLLGGCVGSLVASLLLIPVAGLSGTASLMAIAAALGLLLV